jgi:hypothetical protein
MRNIWREYLTIKGGDFPAWWASLSLEEKKDWQEQKEKNAKNK